MVTYQFEPDDELWHRWKRTVPRDKSLDARIEELLAADADGRVVEGDEGPPDPPAHQRPENRRESPPQSDPLTDVSFPSGRDREACEAAIWAAREYIRDHNGATMRELVAEVMPNHALGYDVPELQQGDRYRGAWYRSVVKPGLEALPDVEKPPRGGSEWRYVGD